MEFISAALSRYVEEHTTNEPEYLYKLNRETHLKVMQPRMLSGHLQGRFLSLISHLMQPQLVLEIGTYTGYSALCLAEGLSPEGKLHTIDNNPEREELVKKYIREANLENRVIPHIGDAAEVIPRIEGTFDLVFIDADKENYSLYYDLVIDRVRPGGLIISDNVLWSGKVLEAVKPNDQETIALLEFNRQMVHDNRVEVVLLPVRDGLSMVRKKLG
jgi:predicted O-methyltransferase YrrM